MMRDLDSNPGTDSRGRRDTKARPADERTVASPRDTDEDPSLFAAPPMPPMCLTSFPSI
jgi:hypothetical protein